MLNYANINLISSKDLGSVRWLRGYGCLCVCLMCLGTHAIVPVQKSKDNLMELVLSSHFYVGSRNELCFTLLWLLSHLFNLMIVIFKDLFLK